MSQSDTLNLLKKYSKKKFTEKLISKKLGYDQTKVLMRLRKFDLINYKQLGKKYVYWFKSGSL